jgi:serine protease Do
LYNPEENGGFIGIGFAIPSSTSKFIVDRLLDPNHPKPGWLGFTLQDSTPELAAAFGLPQYPGAIISAVDPSGPASKASLRPGDVLEKINGAQQSDSRAFMRAIVMVSLGNVVQLTVWREGREQEFTATVGEWPNYMPGGGMMSPHAAQAMIAKAPDPGLRLAPITNESRKQYGLDPKLTGALVSSLESDCEARDLGIVPGDVITAAQGEPVATPDDVRRAVKAAHDQHRPYLAVLVQSKTNARWVSLSIGGA